MGKGGKLACVYIPVAIIFLDYTVVIPLITLMRKVWDQVVLGVEKQDQDIPLT